MPTQSPPLLSRFALVEAGRLRVAPILVLPRVLAEMGQDPQALIAEAQLDPDVFDDPDNTIAFADMGRLLELCAARTSCPHLGLLVGANGGLHVLGVVGKLAACSKDLASALRNIILYLHLHDRGAIPTLSVGGERAAFGYVIYEPEHLGTEIIYDGALLILCNILKELAGPGWEPVEVCLTRLTPAAIGPYRQSFRTRLRFGAEQNAVVFDAGWLNHPLGGSDRSAQECLMREIDRLEAAGAGSLAAQLRRILYRLFISGSAQGEASLEYVSSLFAIHRRTLNRRLQAEGITFKALIESARYDIARQLLRDTQLTTSDIAINLGYADVTAFCRAFRRWSGNSPGAWRTDLKPSAKPIEEP